MKRRAFLQASCALVVAPVVAPKAQIVTTMTTGRIVNGWGPIEPGALVDCNGEILRISSVWPVQAKRA